MHFFLIFCDAVDHSSGGYSISQMVVDMSTTYISCYLAQSPHAKKKQQQKNMEMRNKLGSDGVGVYIVPQSSPLHLCTFLGEHFSILGSRGVAPDTSEFKRYSLSLLFEIRDFPVICPCCAIELVQLTQSSTSRFPQGEERK